MTGTGAPIDEAEAVAAWAASGAMALSGSPTSRGLGPPRGLVPGLRGVGLRLLERSRAIGAAVEVDPLVLLTERAAIAGLTRQGRTSCGGATRLLRAADGWMAVSLARPDDVELVAAWLELPAAPADLWPEVDAAARDRSTDELVARATMLGLPASALPPEPVPPPRAPGPLAGLPVRAEQVGAAEPTLDLSGLVVVDLGSLWAAPLCGSLLADAGATVVKLESTNRPDGARRGPAAFFDLLNAGKASVALDLDTGEGRGGLADLLRSADVVLEASRPRALRQLGVDGDALLKHAGPRVWASITGHGRTGDAAMRTGFGDDAAVAGGLVTLGDGGPYFCADAVADPATGLVTAVAVLDALAAGGRWLIDVSLAGVAAHLAGPTLEVPAGLISAPPARREVRRIARPSGADNEAVFDRLVTRL